MHIFILFPLPGTPLSSSSELLFILQQWSQYVPSLPTFTSSSTTSMKLLSTNPHLLAAPTMIHFTFSSTQQIFLVPLCSSKWERPWSFLGFLKYPKSHLYVFFFICSSVLFDSFILSAFKICFKLSSFTTFKGGESTYSEEHWG